jgi:hypothetical protein
MQGLQKRLVSRITYDNGLKWSAIQGPAFDSNRRVFDCGDSCYLHLHGITERKDQRDRLSAFGAPGIIIGVGNVGPYLLPKADCDTFLSRDAGRSWTEIAKLSHFTEIGIYLCLFIR